ncbi:MAG: hypothetical protein AAFZ07_20660 [Actinomycetota bacterium]
MFAITLPTFLDADNLRTILLLVVVGMLVFAYLVAKLVREVVVKAVVLVLIAIAGFVLWNQRTALGDCIDSDDCSCSIVGFDVQLPSAADRVRCG